MTLGRRIGLTVESSFWLTAVVIGWSISDGHLWLFAASIGVIFVSVLTHELGHALAGAAMGSRADIRLHGFGGQTHVHEDLALWQHALVTLAGPLAGLAAAYAAKVPQAFLFQSGLWHPAVVAQIFIRVTIYWSLFNLVPIVPMDGGLLLSSLLTARFGVKGLMGALLVSMSLAGAGALWGLRRGDWFFGLFLGFFAVGSYRQWRRLREGSPPDDKDPASGEPFGNP